MDTITITSIIVAIICFFITLAVGLTTNLLREKKTDSPCPPCPPSTDPIQNKPPYSFSKVQFWLWTLVICPAFVINWGFHYSDNPYLNETSLILLGISVSVTFSSGVIGSTMIASRAKSKEKYTLKGDRSTDNFWTDILTDGEGQFSIGRLQNFLFTIVYLMIYIVMFFQKDMIYPDFERSAYVLMGISSGGYLLGKANNK